MYLVHICHQLEECSGPISTISGALADLSLRIQAVSGGLAGEGVEEPALQSLQQEVERLSGEAQSLSGKLNESIQKLKERKEYKEDYEKVYF